MSVHIIDTLKPKNNGSFPVAEAVDIAVTASLRLPEALDAKADASDLAETNAAVDNKADAADVTASVANLQGQINQIEISATAEAVVAPEVAAARVSDNGTEYETLKERLDTENERLSNAVSQLYVAETYEWRSSRNDTIGWETGYYNSTIGDTLEKSTSTNYICTHFSITKNSYPILNTAKMFSVTPPAGYAVRIVAADSNDIIRASIGAINTSSSPEAAGQTVTITINPDYKYTVSMGRFSGDASSNLNVGRSSILTFYTAYDESEAVSEYFSAGSTNLIELPENVNLYVSGLNIFIHNGKVSIKGTCEFDGYIKLSNGITIAQGTMPADWLTQTVSNLTVGKTYTYKQMNSKTDSSRNTGLRLYDQEGKYVFTKNSTVEKVLDNAGACWVIRTVSAEVCDMEFTPICAEGVYNDVYMSELSPLVKTSGIGAKNYKPRTGTYEFFTVTVDRPLPFGGEEKTTSTEEVECVLRLPSTYDPNGEPCRLILACHGASGYIQASSNTWYNSKWKEFIDDLLAEGYACFDSNVLPTSYGTDVMGRCLGSPLYVNVLKKAYDYIVSNYNVTPQIIAHGTSMGGVGASAFCNAYPELVICQSSFAGRDITQYLYQILNETTEDPDDFAKVFGYTDYASLIADKFSHVVGLSYSLSLLKYEDGVAQFPPDREDFFTDWLTYYSEIQSLNRESDIGEYICHRSVPYKSWNSWADNEARTKAEEVLQYAYTIGGNAPYYCVFYDEGTHTQMSYGQINNMRDQLIAWFKRWE